MKSLTLVCSLAMMLALFATGCTAKHKVDTSKITKAFAAATGDLKTQANAAVAAIKAGNHTEAVAAVGKMAEKTDLTADQKQALLDTLIDIQVVVTGKPPANADQLFNTIQELMTKLM